MASEDLPPRYEDIQTSQERVRLNEDPEQPRVTIKMKMSANSWMWRPIFATLLTALVILVLVKLAFDYRQLNLAEGHNQAAQEHNYRIDSLLNLTQQVLEKTQQHQGAMHETLKNISALHEDQHAATLQRVDQLEHHVTRQASLVKAAIAGHQHASQDQDPVLDLKALDLAITSAGSSHNTKPGTYGITFSILFCMLYFALIRFCI